MKFEWFFREYKNGNANPSNYKNENNKTQYWKNMWKTRFLEVKSSLLELEKYFTELKDEELKDKELKVKNK